MTVLYIILGIILTALLFLNIKNAADILCRIVGGFAMLVIFNVIAPHLTLPLIGINPVTVLTAGFLGLPGGILLISLLVFL